MVFARLPSILFAWHGVHEKRINSKPFMFAQNFSVCECKFRLSNAVLSLCLFVETFLEIDTEIPIWSSFLFQNQRNHERLVMNENTAEFWNLFLLRVLCNYPASSWFLLRQTSEKPLRATVCFSIEHARVRHAPRDAFDVSFICQFFAGSACTKECKFLAKIADKRTIQTFVDVLSSVV